MITFTQHSSRRCFIQFPSFKHFICLTLFLYLWVMTFPVTAQELGSTVELTAEERAFIHTHPVIQVHNETDWPPFNFAEDGRPKGFSIDFMNLLAKKTGLKVDYITGPSWNEFLEMMKTGDLDVMLNIVKTPDRQKYLLYTPPIADNPNTILSRRDTPYHSLDELFDKTVSVPKGFFYEEVLKRDFPQIKILALKDTIDTMKAVSFGKADAALGELAVFNHLLAQHMMTNLTVSGEVKVGDHELSILNIATRKDLPVLASILTKGVKAIGIEERREIQRKWLEITPAPVKTRKVVELSDEERAWLAKHKTIRLGVDPSFPPFDFIDKNGNHAGMGADYMTLVAERLGVSVKPVPNLSWSQVLEGARRKEIDLLPVAGASEDRRSYLDFTDPYILMPLVIVTRKEHPPVSGLKDFAGKSMVMTKGYYYIDELTRLFPDIKPVMLNTPMDGLRAVSTGKQDAVVVNLGVGYHLIQEAGLLNLRVAAEAELTIAAISMGVRKDWPEFTAILNKTIDSITQEEHKAIRGKWIAVEGEIQKRRTVTLTAEERAWLAKHNTIRLGVDHEYPPFEFIAEDGIYSGMASDYVRLISERLGVTMNVVPGLTWDEVLKSARNLTLDVLPAAAVSPERMEYLNFSNAYMEFPVVIVTRDDYPLVAGLNDLNGKIAAQTKGYAVTKHIEKNYPEITRHLVDGPLEALRSVSGGRTEAAVLNLAVATYLIKKHILTNLKVAAPTDFEIPGLAFAVRKDWPEMVGIINKALASITAEEKAAIRSKWVSVEYQAGIDVKLALQVSGVAVVILIVIVIWNRRLQREVKQRKIAEHNMETAKNKAEQLTQAKSEFVAVISHEVRTPMNGVLGMARLLEEMELTKEQKECVNTIVSSGETLLTIIDDLLDLSKLDAGKLEIERFPFVPADMVEQTIALMKSRADDKGLTFKSINDSRIPAVVVGDSHRVRQIILNLISNAIKFTDDGSVTIEAKMESQTDETVLLSFTVKDTGRGIAPDALDKLFHTYSQGSAEVARRYGGTGLGLAICRRLADLMGGKISVESIVGVGSSFRFETTFGIDQTTDAASLRIAISAPAPVKKQAARPLRVLQVEDNKINRNVIERILSHVGHTVISVTNGADALKAVRFEEFDIVLMDRHMPVMDGIETTHRIRAMEGTIASIPIIGITASAAPSEIDACIEAGMDDCLSKPVEAVRLRALLEDLSLGNKPHRQMRPVTKDYASTVSAKPDGSPIDLSTLSKILDEDNLDELFLVLDLFREEFPSLLANLEAANRERNVQSVHDCAHAAKGAARSAGALWLASTLEHMEKEAHMADWKTIEKRLEEVKTEQTRIDRFCNERKGKENST